MSRRVVGWREWVIFPQLDGVRVKAKVDTGARTSAVHAEDIIDGGDSAIFTLLPDQGSTRSRTTVTAPIVDRRHVRSSTGHSEKRLVVVTDARIGPTTWPIELTLASRPQMGFRMLLGRTALGRRFVVDPHESFLGAVRISLYRPGRPG